MGPRYFRRNERADSMNSKAFDVKGAMFPAIHAAVEAACARGALALQPRAQSRGGVTDEGCPEDTTQESVQFDMGPQLFFQFTLCFHQRFDPYGDVVAGFG
jgi:hypothetical protein